MQTEKLTEEALKAAKAHGLTVSVDLNFRKKLWKWRPGTAPRELAAECMGRIVPFVDWIICNEEDASDVFGIRADATEIEAGKLNIGGYRDVAKLLLERFPKASRVAVTLRESGTLAGVVNLHGVDEAHCCAETSYALSPAYRGAGLMPEALGAVLRFGFAQAGFNRICAEVLAGNAASVRVLEKCGFRREGILRRRYRKDGCFVDAWLYAVLSSEFSDQSK